MTREPDKTCEKERNIRLFVPLEIKRFNVYTQTECARKNTEMIERQEQTLKRSQQTYLRGQSNQFIFRKIKTLQK